MFGEADLFTYQICNQSAGSRVSLRSLSHFFMYAGGDVVGYNRNWAYKSDTRSFLWGSGIW